jgi:hypothetical protein
LVWLTFLVGFPLNLAFSQQGGGQKECAKYSDHFDTYNPERWQEVLLYSRARGVVAVKKGRLLLKAPQKDEPSEIQVYSLFTFDGDFDIQADYDVSERVEAELCRFNAGIVLQTLGDEKSYKCYVAVTPGKDLFFRARLDLAGEDKLEKHKKGRALECGTIRITRKDGRLSFLILKGDEWYPIYNFRGPCREKLRMRFKLQTGDDEERQTCPATVRFDNFIVNSCDTIVQE